LPAFERLGLFVESGLAQHTGQVEHVGPLRRRMPSLQVGE
jgi:hypothetical protein